jgi:hypothetical protein
MISVVQNIATPEPNESSAPRVCPASEERSLGNESPRLSLGTQINPESPAHRALPQDKAFGLTQ